MEHRDANGYLLIRWVHVISSFLAVLVVWLLTAGVIYGTMRTEIDNAKQRIRDLEEQHFVPGNQSVTKDQFLEFEKGVLNRLDSIDRKLDRIDRR